MNHLNVFNPYKNKANHHEDELTRAFLILLRNIPMVQLSFIEMVKDEMGKGFDTPIINGGPVVEQVFTQVSNSNSLFRSEEIEGRTLVSILISDDRFKADSSVVKEDRTAVYDGVILCSPSWLFIVENKPSRDNVWANQLNPNISQEVTVVDKPCCLSWRSVLENLNGLVSNHRVSGLERVLIEDFLEYVDTEYSWLNPYTTFEVCKNDTYLLNKRCINVMATSGLGIDGEVRYHKGWKHYLESGKDAVRKIALDATQTDNRWAISLWLYVGDTMSSARKAYQDMDVQKVLGLREKGFQLSTNFHVSYQSSNLLWFDGILSVDEYLAYWKKNAGSLKQAAKTEFQSHFEALLNDGMITTADWPDINGKILSKGYDKLNTCPGFLIKYTWEKDSAITLDRSARFEADFRLRVSEAFSALGLG